MWVPLAVLGVFVVLLAVVTVIKVRRSVAMVRWTVETMDGSTRWVGGVALVPGAVVAVVSIVGGWEPPHGILVGLVCAAGWFVALLGGLGFEGVLLERESEAQARIAARQPPPSTRRGRVVALVVGTMIAAASLVPLFVFPQPG